MIRNKIDRDQTSLIIIHQGWIALNKILQGG